MREALFSSLAAMELFDGGEVRVLDVFSGSGSIGLEALSRGSWHCLAADCIIPRIVQTQQYVDIDYIVRYILFVFLFVWLLQEQLMLHLST